MIITRTPFRVSFAGGGTDLPEFYRKNGYGAVVSAAIKKYMYIVIHPYFHDKIRLKYSRTEDVESVQEIQHPIFRECLRRVGVEKGVEIASFADISSGTGLGSSSSFTVGLLHALYAYRGKDVSKHDLAAEACEIEIDVLKEPIGKQDQYAAAFGGLNYLQFNDDESVDVVPLKMDEEIVERLETIFCLYYAGGQRRASEILLEQRENIVQDEQKQLYLKRILELTGGVRNALEEQEIESIGVLLHNGWESKKELSSGISNEKINYLYEKALHCGASGGRLLGAGGAGFLLIAHTDHGQLGPQLGCRTVPFRIDRKGSEIIFAE